MSNFDDILAQARTAANNLPVAAAPSNVATLTGGVPVGFNMSMDAALDAGGMSVDSYIQVDAPGIKLVKDWHGFIDDFVAELDLSEVVNFRGIRASIGQQVTYLKTYDGQTEARSGEMFAQAAANLQAQATAFTAYAGFELPFTLIDTIEDPKKKGKTLEAGDRVGLTTSPTGSTPAASFLRKIRNAQLFTSVVKVKVSHELKQKAGVKDWGICNFELLEILQDNRPAAAA